MPKEIEKVRDIHVKRKEHLGQAEYPGCRSNPAKLRAMGFLAAKIQEQGCAAVDKTQTVFGGNLEEGQAFPGTNVRGKMSA